MEHELTVQAKLRCLTYTYMLACTPAKHAVARWKVNTTLHLALRCHCTQANAQSCPHGKADAILRGGCSGLAGAPADEVAMEWAAAALSDYVPFGRIHDGSAALVDVASWAGASADAAALSRGRSPPMAATDSAKAAIAEISRYAFALSASVINVLSDASARSSSSSALSMNYMT